MPAPGFRFRVPPSRRVLVDRARLRGLLERPGHRPRLVLIAAPAGFGKTTLLTQWLASVSAAAEPPAVAWLPVDTADHDPHRLLTDITAALNAATDDALPQTNAMLLADRMPPLEDVLSSLVNELDDCRESVILALDDFHLADSPEAHQLLDFMIENLPPRTTVVLTSRADPALPLARLRTRGELVEVRAADLRFTPEEASAFLGQVMGLVVSPDQAAALEARTEGWAAGLQLAGISLRGRTSDLDEFIKDFSGSHRFVLDYLIEEVLATTDDATRDFLQQTAILEQMNHSLCDALTGRTDSQQMLERLEARNLFVVPLDDNREWYRYHHLFADALRARLPAEVPDGVPALHAAAAAWYGTNGMLPESVRHASQAHQATLLADLIEAELPVLRRTRQDQTIIDRLALLAEDDVAQRPLLATFLAWTRMAAGDLADVEPWLTAAEAAFTNMPAPLSVAIPAEVDRMRVDEMRIVPSTIAMYRAALAQARGDTAETAHQAEKSRSLAGPSDHMVHAAAAGFLGLAAWARGELQPARTLFEETKTRLEALGNTADALATTVPVAEMTLTLGELGHAKTMYESAIAAAEASNGVILASRADLHVGLAGVLREHGDFDAAARHLDIARDLGDGASLPENRFRWFVTTSDLLRSTGDLAGSLTMLDLALERYLPGFFPDIRPLPARRVQLLLDLGRLDEARAWATEHDLDATSELTYRNEYQLLTYARLLLTEGESSESAALIDALADLAQTEGRLGSVVELRAAGAVAHHAVGDGELARDRLATALLTGMPAGYRRLYLDLGPALQALVWPGFENPGVERWAQVLRREAAAPTMATVPLQLAAEPLSERELDVLRLLRTDLSGPEIARQLFISLNTFRTHTKRIFTKLDVKTRRAAVTRATELGIA